MGALRSDPPQDLDAINPGHDDVQEYRIRRGFLDRLEAFLATGGDEGLVALALEDFGHHEGHIRLIVNDENSHDTPP